MNLGTPFEMNHELRKPREKWELESDMSWRDSFPRRVKKTFSESPSPFAYFAVSSPSIEIKTSFKSKT